MTRILMRIMRTCPPACLPTRQARQVKHSNLNSENSDVIRKLGSHTGFTPTPNAKHYGVSFASAKRGFTPTPGRGVFGVSTAGAERGFTLVELAIVTVMMGLLLSVVLANFRDNEKRTGVKESSELIASSLRQMQNNTLAGLPLPNGEPAEKYSVEFDLSDPTRYRTYVYDTPSSRQIIENSGLVQGVELFDTFFPGDVISTTVMEIQFVPPFGNVLVRVNPFPGPDPTAFNQAYLDVGNVQTGFSKRISVNGISGQISIE